MGGRFARTADHSDMANLIECFVSPELQNCLFNIGGRTISVNPELIAWRQTPAYAARTACLLKHGVDFDIKTPTVRVQGDYNLCHSNTAALYFLSHGHLEIFTGWALGGSEWSEHSWGLYKGKIWESTAQ